MKGSPASLGRVASPGCLFKGRRTHKCSTTQDAVCARMSRIALTEQQWAFIRPLLPPPARTGRPRANGRRTLEGILYILVTGSRWQDLPREYGAPTTVWRRLKRWGEMGIWEHIWRAALAHLDQAGQLDWSMAFLDGSFAPAKNGGEHVGLTRKGKGTKWMVVVERHGLPLGFLLASANR